MDGVVAIPIPGESLTPFPGGVGRADRGFRRSQFWVGPENRLVPVAIAAVLEAGLHGRGPVVFFGPCGSGKSHLATGLAAAYRARLRRRPVIYATAVDFGRQLADAIETKATDEFRDRYRRASLLVLDDLDLLAGKEASQRELAYTLDTVIEAGGQVVLTSSAAPGQLTGFLPHLRSRLIEGLTIPLCIPGPETRLAIVRWLAELRGVSLAGRAAGALAAGLTSSVPRLAGALATLHAASPAGSPITLHAVTDYLAGQGRTAKPSLRQIAMAVARHFSLRLGELRSPSRRRAVVLARDVAMYLARAMTGESFKQIGSYFNGRDHTTVSHGCLKAESLVGTDEGVREAVERLRAQLQPAWR